MRYTWYRAILVTLLSASAAMAADSPVAQAGAVTASPLAISSVSVGNGYYLAENCTPEADPKQVNECICKADIVKAQVSGLPPKVATTINNQLSQVPERLANESCSGKPASAPEGALQINTATAKYETVYQTPSVLSILVSFATSSAGAAHPTPGSEGYSFNLADGKTLDIASRLTPEQLTKANEFIQQELKKKYGDVMLEEARNHIGPYLSDAGCDNCSIYYGKDGWVTRFAVYSIAPYAVGEPIITIPTSIIPEPETLIAKKK